MSHIQQIVINLLSNAVKYTNAGSVTLSAYCKDGKNPDETILCLSVSDTGIGIDRDEVPSLFEAFSRAEQPSNKYIEGTGLGLAIVKDLCRLMGGKIHVESQKGYGSTFTVELPQGYAKIEDISGTNETRNFTAPEGCILVVDDNPENLSVMQELLRCTQLHVDTVISGKEAVKSVKEKHYHLILLDYMMPDMDGIETLKQMKNITGFDTPVIALTANAISGTRELLIKEGFAEYLTKPIPRGQLETLMMKYLPEELVTITQVEKPSTEQTEKFCAEYRPVLALHNIDLTAAMPIFDWEYKEYLRTAGIFLEHGVKVQAEIAQYQKGNDYGKLIYPVHALKGRAKNLGMTLLADEAERIELLCRSGDVQEALSLVPHLLYLYNMAMKGLEKIKPEIDKLKDNHYVNKSKSGKTDCRRELQEYLDRLQRGPAIECINTLLSMEQTDQEKELLYRMKNAVVSIQFYEASAIYADYMRGGVSYGL